MVSRGGNLLSRCKVIEQMHRQLTSSGARRFAGFGERERFDLKDVPRNLEALEAGTEGVRRWNAAGVKEGKRFAEMSVGNRSQEKVSSNTFQLGFETFERKFDAARGDDVVHTASDLETSIRANLA